MLQHFLTLDKACKRVLLDSACWRDGRHDRSTCDPARQPLKPLLDSPWGPCYAAGEALARHLQT
eukprot:152632-Chlamydomonas_euryale.AAC.6